MRIPQSKSSAWGAVACLQVALTLHESPQWTLGSAAAGADAIAVDQRVSVQAQPIDNPIIRRTRAQDPGLQAPDDVVTGALAPVGAGDVQPGTVGNTTDRVDAV